MELSNRIRKLAMSWFRLQLLKIRISRRYQRLFYTVGLIPERIIIEVLILGESDVVEKGLPYGARVVENGYYLGGYLFRFPYLIDI